MTELSYLIELLLHHDLKPETKESLAERIRIVEAGLTQRAPVAEHPLTTEALRLFGGKAVTNAPEPVAVVAHTPAAQAALASRAKAIAESMDGTINKELGRPRKF